MKTGRKILLVLSHLALIAIGWAIGSALRPEPKTADPKLAVRENPRPRVTAQNEPNPILRARGADFKAAWDEMLRGDRSEKGELRGFSLSIFIDWCGVDPEGAVLGLSKLYAPRFGHNYLSNAVSQHGADLAPALVKHWKSLTLQKSYKLESMIGRSLRMLAQEDPAQAADLVAQLPPGIRTKIYGKVFENLERQELEALYSRIPNSDELGDRESKALWQSFARSLDRSAPKTGVAEWLAKTDDPQARRALVEVAVERSIRNENWDDFLTALESFDATKQAAIINDTQPITDLSHSDGKHRTLLLQSCEARGLDAIAEQIRSHAKE